MVPLGRPVFDHEVAALDVTEVTQFLTEGLCRVGINARVDRGQVAYSSDLGRLLSLGGERRGEEPASHSAEECPPTHYWITSSARDKSDGEIVRPRALAVLRLITSSNLVGCSMGRSAGLAPFRILST